MKSGSLWVLLELLLDQGDDDLVGDERARIHDGRDLLAELRARRPRSAQHVARRQLNETTFSDELLGLCPLARRGRAEQDQVHFFLPPNLARLIMPSYWWPIRCDWICATVSMVTDTTIKSDVPPI